jgi:hypothetical protein
MRSREDAISMESAFRRGAHEDVTVQTPQVPPGSAFDATLLR